MNFSNLKSDQSAPARDEGAESSSSSSSSSSGVEEAPRKKLPPGAMAMPGMGMGIGMFNPAAVKLKSAAKPAPTSPPPSEEASEASPPAPAPSKFKPAGGVAMPMFNPASVALRKTPASTAPAVTEEKTSPSSSPAPSRVAPSGGVKLPATPSSALKSSGGAPATPPTPRGSVRGSSSASQGIANLLNWAKERTSGYEGVQITNFTTSWADGKAFCAIAHSYAPRAFNFDTLPKDPAANLGLAFSTLERLGVVRLLDVEDITELDVPEKLSITTYVSQIFQTLKSRG
eukprot:TRINITY_DN6882_c0_g1_i1.p1 TRINITY_DN6882_c0_g1~~TRINITY_DN6882_c0_g1_i1.p1  ORF type:complete len:333 (-),score=106.84 TRINITY_DN6882_c0_g1_i1:40-900(-)